ncbi:hypothetical protein IPJ72_00775 [Candidatus Peregrinibacteria bacterium]|nr:MAG: hypothetical protein IPJ72_00775 [Candidatus Peregrinibacteria bacterium]
MDITKSEKIIAIVAITQLVKQYGFPKKSCPLVALLVGALLEYAEEQSTAAIVRGIVMGAIATGSYAVVKDSATVVMEKNKK